MTATRPQRLAVVAFVLTGMFLLLQFGYFRQEFVYSWDNAVDAVPGLQALKIAPTPDPLPPLEGPDRFRYARLGIEAPIQYPAEISEDLFQEALLDGVAHYPQTAEIGQPGNAFIFGHSSDLSWQDGPYRHIFALLPHAKIGDEIELTGRTGTRFSYRVTDTFIVSPTDVRVLEQGDGSVSKLTLQTSYPFGTALSRYIVEAELIAGE